MINKKTYCISQPVVNMRKEPAERAEVVSQVFYSEEITLLEEKGPWLKISTLPDHYQGWISKKEISVPFVNVPLPMTTVKINRLAAHLYLEEDTIYGPVITLPFESHLELIEPPKEPDCRWLKVKMLDGTLGYVQRGDIVFESPRLNRQEMCELSHQFLGLPYTWGGRTSFGYDCSGFVQMLYRQQGVFLPRDSSTQCNWQGLVEISQEEIRAGDLIFYGYDRHSIRHVGLCLNEHQFIHAVAVVENAPYIRISRFADRAWNGTGYYPYFTARKLRS